MLGSKVKFRGKDLLLVQIPILISGILGNKYCILVYVLEFIIEAGYKKHFSVEIQHYVHAFILPDKEPSVSLVVRNVKALSDFL